MTSEGEAVCLSLELWKHGENEFKYNVLWSCSLMVEINSASINSISSADPGVINIGESHALSSVAACRRFLKVQFSTLPPYFIEFKKILKKSCQSLGQNSGTKYQLYWLPDCILEQPLLDALNCLIQRTFFTLKIPLSLINKLEISCSKSLQEFWRIDQCGACKDFHFFLEEILPPPMHGELQQKDSYPRRKCFLCIRDGNNRQDSLSAYIHPLHMYGSPRRSWCPLFWEVYYFGGGRDLILVCKGSRSPPRHW